MGNSQSNSNRLIADGYITLTSRDDVARGLYILDSIKQYVTRDVVLNTPKNIDGVAIRGRLDPAPRIPRDTLYYGPEIAKYLPTDAQKCMDAAFKEMSEIALRHMDDIRREFGLSPCRNGKCFDTLTVAYCREDPTTEFPDGESNYGLISVYIADSPGLQFFDEHSGKWAEIPRGTICVNTGKWLQRLLESNLVDNVSASRFRVYQAPKNALFVGFFLEPSISSTIDSSTTYAENIRSMFATSYRGEHPDVKLI